jgi:hypothetical protein
VYRDGTKVATTVGTTYTVSALTCGTSHTLAVQSFDAAGNTSALASTSANTAACTPPPPTSGPCTGSAAPVRYDHVIWIWMENHPYSAIIGSSSAPYENQLANACGLATDYHAVTHPSLPNYIAATSGGTQGISDDNPPSSHPLSVASIFSQVRAAGGTWRAYDESMPSNCALSSSGSYVVKHNPAAYYTGIRSDCASWNVPMGTTAGGAFLNDLNSGSLPTFAFITPNMCNDTHDCSVATGDTWLQAWLPKIFASPNYQAGRTAVFLTWDEDDGSSANRVATIAMSPSVTAGTKVTATFNHYALLHTTEEMLGITSYLGSAANAASMRSAFGL